MTDPGKVMWVVTIEHPDGVAAMFVTSGLPDKVVKVVKKLRAKYGKKLNGRGYILNVQTLNTISPDQLEALMEKSITGLLLATMDDDAPDGWCGCGAPSCRLCH